MNNDGIFQVGAVAEAWPSTFLKRGQNNPRKILVVDDDSTIRRLNTRMLRHSGYHVDGAADGGAAWDALLMSDYDLMITDNNMPNVTGVELLKRVHATRMAMPVVMATGKTPDREFVQYPWLKPAAILLKPYTFTELVETVKTVLAAVPPAQSPSSPPSWQGEPRNGGLRPRGSW